MLLVLMAAVAILRWPRLSPDLVSVTRSEVRGNEMVVEYRMPRAFEVGLAHGIREQATPLDGPGIRVGGEAWVRREAVEFISSEYDWVRGEHYVRLTFHRGPEVVVAGNGHRLAFSAWSAPDAGDVRWCPPGDRARLGDGIGKDIVSFAAAAKQDEYLILYAGTMIRESVK